MIKRFIAASILSFVVMFLLGAVWNTVIMADFYRVNAPDILRPLEASEDSFSLVPIVFGYVVIAFLMTFIVSQNFDQNPKFVGGFMFGATFGISVTLPLYLILYGKWDFPYQNIIADTLWHIVEQGMGAVVICAIIFKDSRSNGKKITP